MFFSAEIFLIFFFKKSSWEYVFLTAINAENIKILPTFYTRKLGKINAKAERRSAKIAYLKCSLSWIILLIMSHISVEHFAFIQKWKLSLMKDIYQPILY